MPLYDEMPLYHGSYIRVPNPDLSKCARFQDFGQGFYLTTSLEQARSFVRLSVQKALDRSLPNVNADKGFISRFVFCTDATSRLSVLEFDDAGPEWLRCVVAHRKRSSFPDIVDELSAYDIIAGKIANDQTNITLTLYIDGIYGQVGTPEAERACITQLMPERLKDQYCFRTEKALSCLSFGGSEPVWL